jgi:hypothetical protein
MSHALKRYTELPFLLHMLRGREIALLSPASWEDRNDALYIEHYRADQGHKSVFALCLTRASTTYHHWKVFAGSTSGVCIYFNEQPLKDWASANGIRFEDVEYLSLRRARKDPPKGENLPFRKRHAFEDEVEVRLLYSSNEQTGAIKSFKFDLAIIDKVEVNPWLSQSVFGAVRESITCIDGCQSLTVEKSTMLDNEEWAKLAALRYGGTPAAVDARR